MAHCLVKFLPLFLAVAACQPAPSDNLMDAPVNEPVPARTLPVIEPPIDRSSLLRTVASAASAYALGQRDEQRQRDLDGRPFEIRIRFGCGNSKEIAEPQLAPFNVRFDATNRTLRLRAAPDLTLDDPAIAALAPDTTEAVEGFWMYRPWLLAAGCPANAPEAPAADAVNPQSERPRREGSQTAPPWPRLRVGIAQLFTKSDSRTGRREARAFEVTKVLSNEEQPSLEGYNLVLAGRFRRIPNGSVISCQQLKDDIPPECVVTAQFDRVWIEQPDSRAALAEWSM